MSLQLQLVVVGLRLRLFSLLVVEQAAIVAHLNHVLLQVGRVGLWVPLNAEHLLADSEDLMLTALRSGKER